MNLSQPETSIPYKFVNIVHELGLLDEEISDENSLSNSVSALSDFCSLSMIWNVPKMNFNDMITSLPVELRRCKNQYNNAQIHDDQPLGVHLTSCHH